jgi:chitobiase/beta-hexosaminidase-like protein/NHL repeat-containing protein
MRLHRHLLIVICLGPLWAAARLMAATNLPPLDLAVARLLGTSRQEEIMLNRIVPWAGAHLGGVHIDTNRTPNRFYVFDSANNRILGIYGFKRGVTNGVFLPADIVIGQPSMWDQGTANSDSTRFMNPSSNTLAFLPFPNVNSTAEAPRSGMMATDTNGNLYVADLNNNRVLKFNDPFTTDAIADDVWGQTSFTNRSTPDPPTASSLRLQWDNVGVFSAGVDVDRQGNLWVADSGNHRVLRFPPGSKTANLVLGQSSFTTRTSGSGLNQMWKPTAVRLHPVTGELFVLDGEQTTTGRLLVFAPPFVNGESAARVIGQAQPGTQASGLHFARGFALDPQAGDVVWVGDGGNHRILKFNSTTGAMLDVIGFHTVSELGNALYERFDGTIGNLRQPDGDIGFDSEGNFFFTMTGVVGCVVRVPMPLQRNTQGQVKSSGQMLKAGLNQISGRTMQDHHGMALSGDQLYGSDRARLLVWTNAGRAATFASADLVIGQSSLDAMDTDGTFGGVSLGQMSAGGDWLFVKVGARIFIFQTPILSGGKTYPPIGILDGNAGSVRWDDDNSAVAFSCNGLVYDPVKNALWISDYPRNRLLRVRDPVGVAPRVDLVIGQTNKTGGAQNHGLGLNVTDARGLAAPWSLALDRFGNLFAVDSGFEGRIDNSGNLRVLRFDAAAAEPVPGNIFPNPAASGVFCKPDLTTNRDWNESNRPRTPTWVAFDSQNRMLLLCDSYGNPQGQRAFVYPTPHLGLVPQPSHILTTSFGQAAVGWFDAQDNLVIQDHTWNRFLFYTAASNAPVVDITNRIVIVPSGATAVTLSGTNSPAVVGTMTWSSSGGATGTFPAAGTAWLIADVPLAGEATIITVSGTNSAGFPGSDTITMSRPGLAAPAIVPAGGSFTSAVAVTLATFQSGVDIRFTLDNSEPSAASPLYSGPLTLTSNATIQAKAFRAGSSPSPTSVADFALYVATPTISPPGGSFTGEVTVTLQCATPGAQIRYTLDSNEPTSNSLLYAEPFALDHNAAVKSKGFRSGMHPSSTAAAAFTNTLPPVGTPMISPSGGLLTGSVDVALSCPTVGAQIRYTLDGSEPHSSSPLYNAPFTLTHGALVKARGYLAGMAPSATASATFALLSDWRSIALPVLGTRDRHVALGSEGTNLFFTRGNSANAGFYRLAKGATSDWDTLASMPLPSTVNNNSGVGDFACYAGALWTLALNNNASPARSVYRYDLAGDSWTKGAEIPGDGPNAACAPIATDKILGGWMGWTRIKDLTDWQGGVSRDVTDLSGAAAHPWDSCLAPDHVYFLKHHNLATNAGVLARINKTGPYGVAEIPGMPFNPGMGCAIEYLPASLFADRHDRLFILRGGSGANNSDGSGWTSDTSAEQLAIYDLVAQTWSTETLPFPIDDGSEMCRVDDILYILAANGDDEPLKMAQVLPFIPSVPRLNLRRTGNDLLLSWPAEASQFVLEATTNLAQPIQWAPLASGTTQYTETLEGTSTSRFYRLRWP